MTVYLGMADTLTEGENFDASADANLEGKVRLERGRNFLNTVRSLPSKRAGNLTGPRWKCRMWDMTPI